MQLTPAQTEQVWKRMVAAEVRSLYFGDLASRYVRRKQILSGVSFFFSSAAAVALGARAAVWMPLGMSCVSALSTAYSIAVGLDKAAARMAKLHSAWNYLNAAYERLWNRWYEDDADEVLEELQRRAREASEQGTEAPYDEKLLAQWEDKVIAQYAAIAA